MDVEQSPKATTHNHQHDAAMLLEVLEVQRPWATCTSNVQALTDPAHALVAVEQASGSRGAHS